MTTTPSTSSHVRALTEPECQQRLAAGRVGRVAWDAPDGPVILPVSYELHLGRVSFRTSPYGALSSLAEPTNVAFEIDEIDLVAGTAWSVLVRGRAAAVTSPVILSTLWRLEGMVPWATGTRNLVISIQPGSVSGRRLRAPFAG